MWKWDTHQRKQGKGNVLHFGSGCGITRWRTSAWGEMFRWKDRGTSLQMEARKLICSCLMHSFNDVGMSKLAVLSFESPPPSFPLPVFKKHAWGAHKLTAHSFIVVNHSSWLLCRCIIYTSTLESLWDFGGLMLRSLHYIQWLYVWFTKWAAG